VPLVAKLVGANCLIVASLVVLGLTRASGMSNAAVALVVSSLVGVHLLLVTVALRPVRDLESVASRVWNGDLRARVGRSMVADEEVLRIGTMFNILLDGLVADRARMRALASEVISAGDRERSALARELHDSTAQRVAALLFQLSRAARDANDPALADRLVDARNETELILTEIRSISHTMHSAVLEDLGLGAALRRLARDSSHGNGIITDVNVEEAEPRLPANTEAALYRIAQEAMRNAVTHGSPRHIRIALLRTDDSAVLEVEDDGRGFDLSEADIRRSGIGLLSLRERAALLDGELDIRTAPGDGTTIRARIPLSADPDIVHSERP
jgi:signal transduction histidine kinase